MHIVGERHSGNHGVTVVSFYFSRVIMMQIQKSWSIFIICIPSHGTHLSRVEGCRQIYPCHVRCRISSSSGWGGKSDSCDWWKATGAEKMAGISEPRCASCNLSNNVWQYLPDHLAPITLIMYSHKQGLKRIVEWSTAMTDLGLMVIKAGVKYCLKDLTVMLLHLTAELFTHVASYLCSVPKSHSSSSPCCAKDGEGFPHPQCLCKGLATMPLQI